MNVESIFYLTRKLKASGIAALLVLVNYGCSTKENQIDETFLTGHWLTTQPKTTPDIILDKSRNFLLLLEDTTFSDTLHFTYRLEESTITIFNSPEMWISKNDILKLSTDSLVYQRKGDKAIFRYGRKS